MKSVKDGIVRIFLTMVLALLIGAVLILAIGENPIIAYRALLKGAFVGKLSLGTTLASFTPLLLTSMAFVVAAQAGAFNVGVEGEVFLGGITAAYIGYQWDFLPAPLLMIACFAGAMVVTALWAFIPAWLKAYYNVSEVCTTILMNSVALYITSYLVSGPMSAGSANPQSPPVLVKLKQFMRPSSVNVGIFLAIAVVLLVIFMLYRTSMGYKFRLVGTNPAFADFTGINSKHVFIRAMMVSGMIGGIAGTIEVLGVYGYFLNNFATGLGSNGMLAALIVKSNVVATPFMAFFLAVLKSGAMGMQQATGVPKGLVDTITAVFIIIATMETLFDFLKRRKADETKIELKDFGVNASSANTADSGTDGKNPADQKGAKS